MLGVLEEVHNLGDLHLGLGESCHILEGHLVSVILIEESRLGLADTENAATASSAAIHFPEHEEPQRDEQDDGAKGPYHHREVASLVILYVAGENALFAPLLDIVLELVGAGNLGSHLGS